MKKNVRKQGILLPISSIPSTYGIGTFGKESYRFVDFLEKSGNHLWQILPLGPTGYGDSPYQSFSTFAGNPYYIDLELLIEDGYLTKEICDSYDFGDNEHYVDYEKIYLSRFKVLKIAFDNAREQGLTETGDYQKFLTENAYWLDDYALYMAVKNAFGGVCFMEWAEDIRLRKAAALRKYRKKLAEEIAFYCFQQYLFAKQWKELKAYANKKGIEIVGDIPIYVAFDSADTWANPKLFQLDKEGRPIGVAGCPPDCFSETGQLWGNPLYDWSYHKKTGYAWWMQRIAYCYQLYDVLRIDHFRGNDQYEAHHTADSNRRSAASTTHNRSSYDNSSRRADCPITVRFRRNNRVDIPPLRWAGLPYPAGTASGLPRYRHCQMPHRWEYPLRSQCLSYWHRLSVLSTVLQTGTVGSNKMRFLPPASYGICEVPLLF